MDTVIPLQLLVPVVCLLLVLFVFFGFGAAVQSIVEKDLEEKKEDGLKKAARVLEFCENPGSFINAVQLYTVITGLLAGALFAGEPRRAMAARLGNIPAADIISCVILYVPFVIVTGAFAIALPRRLAQRHPERWALALVNLVRLLMIPLMPVLVPVRLLSGLFMTAAGIDPHREEEDVTEDDIMSMVNEGHEQGAVESDEAEMITNIFQLNDKEACDVMTHRLNIDGLDGEMKLGDAVSFMLREGSNSRYPVYEKNIDGIFGILNLRDAVMALNEEHLADRKLKDLKGILREAHFIPETRALDTLFKEMQTKRIHMVVVVDEYGQTAGIVTMEDILEEIVGNIMDEYDPDETLIRRLDDGAYVMNGLTPIEDVEETFSVRFSEEEEDDFDTLNGFLISKLDRIPEDGERFTVNAHGLVFRALSVRNKMVQTVRVTRKAEVPSAGETPKEGD